MRNNQKKTAIDYICACGRILSQRFGSPVFTLAISLLFTSGASAQLTNSDVLGTVTDATGAVVPEAGPTAEGVVNIVSHSGTNQFHGSDYEFFRNDIVDCRNVFQTNGRKPELRQHQFGGSIGGPIIKDRTFFYFDHEGLRLVSGVTYFKSVPTIAEYNDINSIGPGNSPQGLLSAAIGTAGLSIEPIALNYRKLYPAPSTGAPGQLAKNFTITPNNSGGQDRSDQIRDTRLGNKTLSNIFDTTAFAPQPLGTVGTAQRNSLFGPNFRHVDPVTERTKVQFRAESFNISNTPNFYIGNGSSGASFGNTAFGGVSQTDPNYAPWQYQFAIKAHF